jgi:hypothetical protein
MAVIGLLMGGLAGGIVGILGGLGYTNLASTTSFEGYSGFVIVFWMLGGIVLGMVVGFATGLKRSAI